MSSRNIDPKEKIDQYFSEKADDVLELGLCLYDIIMSCPLDITADYKWNQPIFLHNGVVCAISVYRKHVSLFFFRGAEIKDPYGLFEPKRKKNSALRQIKISVDKKIIPSILKEYIVKASNLNAKDEADQTALSERFPAALMEAFEKYPKAKENFQKMNISRQSDFVNWLNEETERNLRERRIDKSIALLLEGKRVHQKKIF